MKLNVKKIILVVLLIVLIVIGIWAGIVLTTQTEQNEKGEQETSNMNVIDNNLTNQNLTNNVEIMDNTIDSNNTNSNINITTSNNVINDNTTSDNISSKEEEKKEDLNSYLEKFSLICYLDERTKNLEKEIKRNEDYIDIAMHIAKESNALGTTVEGKEAASKSVINAIISEIRGRTTENLEIANILYSYDNSTEQYYSIHTDNRIAHILQILENTTENGVVEVKYTCCFPNETQLANNDFSGLGKYVITMELKENSSYKYSKYRIQNYEFVVE